MIERHGGGLRDIERLFAAEHWNLQHEVHAFEQFGFNPFNFTPDKQGDFLGRRKIGQSARAGRLLNCRNGEAVLMQLCQNRF